MPRAASALGRVSFPPASELRSRRSRVFFFFDHRFFRVIVFEICFVFHFPKRALKAPTPPLNLTTTPFLPTHHRQRAYLPFGDSMSSPGLSPASGSPSAMGMSVKDRARTWQAAAAASPPPAPAPAPVADVEAETLPVEVESESEMEAPPTIEEIEAMEKAAAAVQKEEEEEEEDKLCTTPCGSTLPTTNTNKKFSRQVSRVSGTGRAAVAVGAVTPRAAAEAAAKRAAAAAAAAGDAACGPNRSGRSQPNHRRPRRSISVDDPDRRPRHQRSSRGHNPMIAASKNGAPPARRPALKPTGSSRQLQNNAGGRQQSARRVQLPNASSSGSITNPRAGARGRAPYTAQGTPSASAATTNRTRQQQQQQQQQKQQKQQKQQPAFPGGSRNFDITSSPPAVGSEQAPKIRRSNSAPDMGVMGEGEEAPVAGGSPQKTCWGGGLPPTCGPAAARAAVAAAAAQQQASAAAGRPSVGSTAGSSRYPANDRESFARTLNEEELDEVWKGLGEGVSQRGCGSEVAFDVGDSGNAPASPTGTAVSGTFPQLTANVLQRHDQLADGAGQHASVMPMPKTLGGGDNGNGRTPEEMENGTAKSSSKKSKSSGRSGQEPQQETTLLGAIVSYGIFLLWVAHLVFNVLLL